jgi:hypothetical protein
MSKYVPLITYDTPKEANKSFTFICLADSRLTDDNTTAHIEMSFIAPQL